MMKFAKIILILILMFLFYGCATDSEEVVKRPSGPYVPHIYLEQESIIAYFESFTLHLLASACHRSKLSITAIYPLFGGNWESESLWG
jgi:hypothetical protein